MAVKTKNNLEATLNIEYGGGHFYDNLIKYLNEKAVEVYKSPEEDRLRSFPDDLKITLTDLETFYQKVDVYYIKECAVKIIGRSKISPNFMCSVSVLAYGKKATEVINDINKLSK